MHADEVLHGYEHVTLKISLPAVDPDIKMTITTKKKDEGGANALVGFCK